MPQLTVRTNALAADTIVEGALIPGSGASETFDEVVWIRRLQDSLSLVELLTDDAHGAGSSTLILVDSAGGDVPQNYAETFLSFALEDIPGKVDRNSIDSNIVYVGRTQTPGALESDPVWQIYEYTIDADQSSFANGGAYDQRWDQRESIVFP